MVLLTELVSYINQLLQIDKISDYCPNGLQLEGGEQLKRIVTGVTASQQLIDAAIDYKADAILVHHGYFWKNEDPRIVGIKKRRIASLLNNNISLLAYHLPLDLHPELGNNVQLAKQFGWQPDKVLSADGSPSSIPPLVRTTTLEKAITGADLAAHISACLQRETLHIDVDKPIRRIAWCTGAAQSEITQAIAMGVDAFITGEASEPTVHEARESGVHFYAAGHHATERYGVKALGEALAQKWQIDCHFIDCDNPV
jgi:dinuclear metal center YbgI/SA1388 family protein